nr:MAG TPA: hypothetical protein [Caudoviricetes sp.]
MRSYEHSWDGNTLSWYSDNYADWDAIYQFNVSGTTYSWLAVAGI